jgi:hypothetical protein
MVVKHGGFVNRDDVGDTVTGVDNNSGTKT